MSDLIKSIPKDPNARFASVMFGLDPITGDYYPITTIDNGDGTHKLSVDAAFSGSISIGNISIKDATGNQLSKVTTDGKLHVTNDDNALYQSNMTQEWTYRTSSPGNGKINTLKEYPQGAAGGSAAKLTTYTYDSSDRVIKAETTNTTV